MFCVIQAWNFTKILHSAVDVFAGILLYKTNVGILRNKIWNMNNIILYLSDSSFSEVLMFGTFSFSNTKYARNLKFGT